MPLNEMKVRNAKTKEKPYKISNSEGLYCTSQKRAASYGASSIASTMMARGKKKNYLPSVKIQK
jgi:hypothetical protein